MKIGWFLGVCQLLSANKIIERRGLDGSTEYLADAGLLDTCSEDELLRFADSLLTEPDYPDEAPLIGCSGYADPRTDEVIMLPSHNNRPIGCGGVESSLVERTQGESTDVRPTASPKRTDPVSSNIQSNARSPEVAALWPMFDIPFRGAEQNSENSNEIPIAANGVLIRHRVLESREYSPSEPEQDSGKEFMPSRRIELLLMRDLEKHFTFSEKKPETILSEFWHFLNTRLQVLQSQEGKPGGSKNLLEKELERSYNKKHTRESSVNKGKKSSAILASLGRAHMKTLEIWEDFQMFSETLAERVQSVKGEEFVVKLDSGLQTCFDLGGDNFVYWFQLLVPVIYLKLEFMQVFLNKYLGLPPIEKKMQHQELWKYIKALWSCPFEKETEKMKKKKIERENKHNPDVSDLMKGVLGKGEVGETNALNQSRASWYLLEHWIESQGVSYYKPLLYDKGSFKKKFKIYLASWFLEFMEKRYGKHQNIEDYNNQIVRQHPHTPERSLHPDSLTSSQGPNLSDKIQLQFEGVIQYQGVSLDKKIHARQGGVHSGSTYLAFDRLKSQLSPSKLDKALLDRLSRHINVDPKHLEQEFFWNFFNQKIVGSLNYKVPAWSGRTTLKIFMTRLLRFKKSSDRSPSVHRNIRESISFEGLALLSRAHLPALRIKKNFDDFLIYLWLESQIKDKSHADFVGNLIETNDKLDRNPSLFWFQILVPVLHFKLKFLINIIDQITGEKENNICKGEQKLFSFVKELWQMSHSQEIVTREINIKKINENDVNMETISASVLSKMTSKANNLNILSSISWYLLEVWAKRESCDKIKLFFNDSEGFSPNIKKYLNQIMIDFFLSDPKQLIRKEGPKIDDQGKIKKQKVLST